LRINNTVDNIRCLLGLIERKGVKVTFPVYSPPRFFIHEQRRLMPVSAACRDRERFVEVLEEEGIQAEAIQILTQGSSNPRD
jgi:hypothetical protein